MPLNKSALATALEAALGAGESGLDGAAKANIEGVASDMADAIDVFVKSGTVLSSGVTATGPSGGPLPIPALTGAVT